MARTSGGSSRAGGWVLALVATVTLALVAGVVYYWMISQGMAPVPAVLAPPTTTPRAPAPLPVRNPRVAAAELVELAPEITPAAAVLLVHEVPNASGPGLADFGLVVATRGFSQMAQADLNEMSALIDQSYATLPPADRTWMGDYMRMLRDGTITEADGARGRRLLTQAVKALPADRRERLQALMETAIRAGIEARRQAEARGQQEVQAPPSGAARPAAPVAVADAAPERAPRAPSSPDPAAGSTSTSSVSGQGEAYWRGRMKAARSRVVTLRSEVEALDQEVKRWMYGPGEGPTCPGIANTPAAEAALQDCLKTKQNWQLTWQVKQKDRLDRLTRKKEELAAAEKAIEETEDEARRDGALPGWLRE